MGMFDGFFLNEKKQKKENLQVLDTKNLDINDGDSIVVSGHGHVNNMQFYQYERGQSETARIETYRQIAKTAEIDEVISDIVNESFIFQRDKKAFELDWHPDVEISDQLKEKIYNEFVNLYAISNFDDIGSDLIQQFYIDGRIVFDKVIDQSEPKKGIRQVLRLDPLNIVKVKVIPPRNRNTQMINATDIQEFFVYSNKKINNQSNYLNNVYSTIDDVIEGKRLETSRITYVTSGLTDAMYDMTIGHLDKAIVPYNNLKMMEQSMVIYRVVRAPMRRAFYIDVSSLPKSKAEEYMQNMSNRFKSKLVYNSETGSWVDQRSVISMAEDYFIPRFNESRTTEIQNIDGQSSQEILDEVNYMKDKLYQSLNAPKSRYAEEGNIFVYGKSDQISRDEYRYKKFIDRLRNRFMLVFDDLLKTQLLLKSIISESDWEIIKRSYFWDFTEDNAFIEYKDAEILNNRIDMAAKMADLIEGGYYSKLWIRKRVLMQTDAEIAEIDMQVFKEKNQDPNQPPENIDAPTEEGDELDIQNGEDDDTGGDTDDGIIPDDEAADQPDPNAQ